MHHCASSWSSTEQRIEHGPGNPSLPAIPSADRYHAIGSWLAQHCTYELNPGSDSSRVDKGTRHDSTYWTKTQHEKILREFFPLIPRYFSFPLRCCCSSGTSIFSTDNEVGHSLTHSFIHFAIANVEPRHRYVLCWSSRGRVWHFPE